MAYQPAISSANRKYVSPSFAPDGGTYYHAIVDAVNDIPVNASGYPNEAWTVFVFPGTYNETIALKSNISLVGSGIDSTIIKGNGDLPVISGPASDGGPGRCVISNITIDGNHQSAIAFPNSAAQKTAQLINLRIFTSVDADAPAVTIGNHQTLDCTELACLTQPIVPPPPPPALPFTAFSVGVRVVGSGYVRLWQSTFYTLSYCLESSDGAPFEAYGCLLSSNGSSVHVSGAMASFYNCITVGQILAESAAKVSHVNSFHDGHFTASSGATIYVNGMKWGEAVAHPERGNIDIIFFLEGADPQGHGSTIVVSNSRAGAQVSSYVAYVSNGCIFKAYNSEFINNGSGATITGDLGVTVYLYNCVLNTDATKVVLAADSALPGVNTTTQNSE